MNEWSPRLTKAKNQSTGTETASLQEAGRALAIGPHPSSYLNSQPFLVRSSN